MTTLTRGQRRTLGFDDDVVAHCLARRLEGLGSLMDHHELDGCKQDDGLVGVGSTGRRHGGMGSADAEPIPHAGVHGTGKRSKAMTGRLTVTSTPPLTSPRICSSIASVGEP